MTCPHPTHLLPGRFRIERGTPGDYHALAHFHYALKRPATIAAIWRIVYINPQPRRAPKRPTPRSSNRKSPIQNPKSRTVAVATLSYPTPACLARERALRLVGPRYGAKLAYVNRHVRTISRVIVHPQFRGLGLAARLVDGVCHHCPTRYVEAVAAMGDVHPFFQHAGMTRVAPARAGEPAYFLFDRKGAQQP